MMKAIRPFQSSLGNHYEDSPSSEEENEEVFSSDEEEDEPNQQGIENDATVHEEIESVEKRVGQLNDTIRSNANTGKKTGMVNPLKVLVSKKKRRCKLEGFNLDLTYVTETIIAMGFPAEKLESIYRNSMVDVKGFFNSRHPSQYRIYNLCAEDKYQYNSAHFNDNVGLFGCYDHQAPPMKLIFSFCEDMKIWLGKNEKNVAAIHCKAGKGRTGVMICCYLVYSGYTKNALEALRYYGAVRTKNKKGVTIPSQIRYVYYFERAFHLGWTANTIPVVTVAIKKIKIHTIPKFSYLGGCSPYFLIENVKEKEEPSLYDSRKQFPIKSYKNEAYIEFTGIKDVIVTGDILIEFINTQFLSKKKKMCQTWFNTSFLPENGVLIIDKSMVDKACKDRENKKFNKDFKIEIQYEILSGEGAN